MAERITANLPSRDFDATEAFYAGFGFSRQFRSDGWMILRRGESLVEFFPHPALDPRESWFSACLRTDALDDLFTAFRAAGLSEDPQAIPRLVPPMIHPGAPRYFALVDEDGSLWRCIEETA
ncbi:bleomycin resistance protein [Sinisalibacter aestuarii]|uniref:Bleomycin resistance protein n=1 Tax=Sinisalibacter aestuarii TaxID=2949426 RepID=A0ABQ5LZF5_9RHOB|nr:bleomycin resistance protein [Sinisalibacter aestuarii]GKY90223.1 bleomycin resistance protein [Sinisalibacter aestuarii]